MGKPATTCPNCGEPGLAAFHRCARVPAHSMLLLRSRDEALAFPTGDITLAHCPACQFITNLDFDPALERYGAEYEASQAYSPTFNAFHRRLAEDLIARHDLHGRDIVEIGCGQGEFLRLLCELGGNRGLGFDPAYVGSDDDADGSGVRVIADFYSEAHGERTGDFVCCKQTLEHIPDTAAFVATVRRAIGERRDTGVFFQVPDTLRILREGAFWDVYYEHCSYFTRPSLIHVFRRAGFEVIDARVEYDGQYLMVEARPGPAATGAARRAPTDDIGPEVTRFAETCRRQIAAWREALAESRERGRRVALWGGGSKAVAFLTTLGAGAEVAFAVDINPRKQGTFLPGTGHAVVGPEHLRAAPPDEVVVMNPIYMNEIAADLARMGLRPRLIPVTAFAERIEAGA